LREKKKKGERDWSSGIERKKTASFKMKRKEGVKTSFREKKKKILVPGKKKKKKKKS